MAVERWHDDHTQPFSGRHTQAFTGMQPIVVHMGVEFNESEAAAEQISQCGVSEDALTRIFAATHVGEFVYNHGSGKWLEYDGAIWREDERQRVRHCVRLICRRHSKSARFQKAATASGVEALAKADPTFSRAAAEFDQDRMLLGTPCGPVDLTCGKLRPPDFAYLITRSTSVAPAEGEPKRWLAFLNEATGGDKDVIRFIQLMLGYSLTGDTREHMLFFIYGPGGNGKGVFLNTVSKILGSYAQTTSPETFMASRLERHPTDLAALDGPRLVTASETGQGRYWDDAKIKMATGGDPITARFMRGNFFTYDPQFKLVISGNHEPAIKSVDEATRRRINIIPFTNKPAQKDPLLERRLVDEHPQILQWMIDGCLAWLEEGLHQPKAVADQTALYFSNQDVLGRWIDECCDVDRTYSELCGTLYESYQRFTAHAGERVQSQRALAPELRKRGFQEGRSSHGRCWRGLKLRLPSEHQADPTKGAAAPTSDALERP